MTEILAKLKSKLDKQNHVLRFWYELSDTEQKTLISQIDKIDIQSLEEGLIKALVSKNNPQLSSKDILPLDSSCILVREDLSNEHRNRLYNLGITFVATIKIKL